MASHRELRVQEQEISPAHGTFLPRSGEQRHADTQDLEVQRHAVIQFQESCRLICAGESGAQSQDFCPHSPRNLNRTV